MFAARAEGVYKYYKNGIHGKKEVLKTVYIEIEEGEIFGLDALSTGTKQRLSLAKALLNEPHLKLAH